ncbi:MAG: ABC transporter substrate-binding protein, partial [Gammaproteobacteria bacterium]|nr:ABC transporter substrate-binding protein [Gammaproteobacteria bacterium]
MMNLQLLGKFGVVAGMALGLMAGVAQAKVEGDTIILGAALSETGKYSTNGIHAKNGYNLAVKRINEMGGVKVGGKSYKLDIKYYDDESTPARGAQLAERLIKQDGVEFMLGPYSSGLTKAIAPITEKYGIPMVEAEGASRSLFTQGFKYLFAVLSTSEQYLASAIGLAAELAEKSGKKPSDVKVAMAFENDPFSL